MSKGTKNYFRHSVFAHTDCEIVSLIKGHGKEAYFHYFALLEMCAAQYIENNGQCGGRFAFHVSRVCGELFVTRQRLGGHLLAIQSSLGGHWVVKGSRVEIEYEKILKYIGSYGSFLPQLNKTKLNKIKSNEIKGEINTEKSSKDPAPDLHALNAQCKLVMEKYAEFYFKCHSDKPTFSESDKSDFMEMVIAHGVDRSLFAAEVYFDNAESLEFYDNTFHAVKFLKEDFNKIHSIGLIRRRGKLNIAGEK